MSRNIIQDYIEINKKELKSYIKLIFSNQFNNDISEKFEDTYINVRYYNYYNDNEEISFRKKLLNSLKETQEKLINDNIEEKNYIQNMCLFYDYMLYFDSISYCKDLNKRIEKLNKLRERVLHKESPKFEDDFYEINTKYKIEKDDLMDKLSSKNFIIKTSTYPDSSNLYRVNLKYDIKFPMIYSQLAIQKAFNTGITNEDKLEVEYYLLSLNIIKDLAKGNFKKLYFVEFADTLLKKQTKIKGILNIISNPAMQDKVRLRITYTHFLENKEEIYNLTKDGYKFAVIIDDSCTANFSELQILNIFDYAIISKELRKYDEIMDNKVILNNIIEI